MKNIEELKICCEPGLYFPLEIKPVVMAAALLIIGGCTTPAVQTLPEMVGTDVKCAGVNACKGKGACKSINNTCKAKNSCKGEGWLSLSKQECVQKGGVSL